MNDHDKSRTLGYVLIAGAALAAWAVAYVAGGVLGGWQ